MNKEFGKKLRKHREDKNITIRQLADKVGISEKILCNIEAGNSKVGLSYSVIESISKALGLEPELLISEDIVK